MTKTISYALAAESIMNLFGAIGFLLYPEWCLSYVIHRDSPSKLPGTSTVHPASATLFQVYGCLVIALTVPLLICIRDAPGAKEKRIIIFQTLAAGEALLVSLMLWKAIDAERSGYTRKGLILSAMSLAPYLVWRAWALLVKPDLLGDGPEQKRKSP